MAIHWRAVKNSLRGTQLHKRQFAIGVNDTGGHLLEISFNTHCNGNSVYIFLFWELRGLSPNFHIHVSVSDLYITRISPHISSSRKGRPIVGIYNSLTDTWMWKLGLRPSYSFSGNIYFKFSGFCLCSAGIKNGGGTAECNTTARMQKKKEHQSLQGCQHLKRHQHQW